MVYGQLHLVHWNTSSIINSFVNWLTGNMPHAKKRPSISQATAHPKKTQATTNRSMPHEETYIPKVGGTDPPSQSVSTQLQAGNGSDTTIPLTRGNIPELIRGVVTSLTVIQSSQAAGNPNNRDNSSSETAEPLALLIPGTLFNILLH